jgi:hypothetical protein
MLTGTRGFDGGSVAATLGNVIGKAPAWERLPPGLAPELVSVLRGCLRKDVDERTRTVAEVKLALAAPLEAWPSRNDRAVAPDAAGTPVRSSLLSGVNTLLKALLTSLIVSIAALVSFRIALGWSFSPNEMAVVFGLVLAITSASLMRRSRAS